MAEKTLGVGAHNQGHAAFNEVRVWACHDVPLGLSVATTIRSYRTIAGRCNPSTEQHLHDPSLLGFTLTRYIYILSLSEGKAFRHFSYSSLSNSCNKNHILTEVSEVCPTTLKLSFLHSYRWELGLQGVAWAAKHDINNLLPSLELLSPTFFMSFSHFLYLSQLLLSLSLHCLIS